MIKPITWRQTVGCLSVITSSLAWVQPEMSLRPFFIQQSCLHGPLSFCILIGPVDYSSMSESLRYIKRKQGSLKWAEPSDGAHRLSKLFSNRNFWNNLIYHMPSVPTGGLRTIVSGTKRIEKLELSSTAEPQTWNGGKKEHCSYSFSLSLLIISGALYSTLAANKIMW